MTQAAFRADPPAFCSKDNLKQLTRDIIVLIIIKISRQQN